MKTKTKANFLNPAQKDKLTIYIRENMSTTLDSSKTFDALASELSETLGFKITSGNVSGLRSFLWPEKVRKVIVNKPTPRYLQAAYDVQKGNAPSAAPTSDSSIAFLQGIILEQGKQITVLSQAVASHTRQISRLFAQSHDEKDARDTASTPAIHRALGVSEMPVPA